MTVFRRIRRFVSIPTLSLGAAERPRDDAAAGASRLLRRGRLTFHLPTARGFCYGVERALRLAEEAISCHPGKRLHITSPILHNPQVNDRLRGLGVTFLSERPERWAELGAEDLVLLPAFGVEPGVEERVRQTGAVLVDTTCGSVVYVWKSVDRFVKQGFTLIYHGKPGHEEAVATLGRLPAGDREWPHLIVERFAQAQLLADAIRDDAKAAAALQALSHVSAGFLPSRDLSSLALASQTTMLSSETRAIEHELRQAFLARHGQAGGASRFKAHDTICGATQERQDALKSLLETRMDLVLIVGGHTSSNSTHLAELAAEKAPTFHVEGPGDITSREVIRHRDTHTGGVVSSRCWLPDGSIAIAATSGASTPEQVLQAVIDRVAAVGAER